MGNNSLVCNESGSGGAYIIDSLLNNKIGRQSLFAQFGSEAAMQQRQNLPSNLGGFERFGQFNPFLSARYDKCYEKLYRGCGDFIEKIKEWAREASWEQKVLREINI